MFRSVFCAACLGVTGLAATTVVPALAQALPPLESTSPDNLRRYGECMTLARRDPLRALPAAEKWMAEGGGLGARHCVAIAMFESGRHVQAATQLEAIARDMGAERPGLRAELYAQAGQAWMEAGQAENAANAQSKALGLKTDDPDLWKWRERTTTGEVDRRNGSIVLLDDVGNEKLRWNFREGWPTRWSGPTFNATASEIAIEQLEIAHEGLTKG